MIRTSAMSIASLLSTVAFSAEGLGNGHSDVATEEAAIASITHLSIEEVNKRLTGISETFNISMQDVTDEFYDAAKHGDLPTAEEEQQAQQQEQELLDSLFGSDDLDN